MSLDEGRQLPGVADQEKPGKIIEGNMEHLGRVGGKKQGEVDKTDGGRSGMVCVFGIQGRRIERRGF